MKYEKEIVKCVVNSFLDLGYIVSTEVANLYRSADIAAIKPDRTVSIIECKISNMSKAIEQSKTHKLTADRVYIATLFRKTKEATLEKIKKEGIGLIYVMPNGTIEKAIEASDDNKPWIPARNRLVERILEAV